MSKIGEREAQIRALREAKHDRDTTKRTAGQRVVTGLKDAIAFAKGDESRGRKTTIMVPELQAKADEVQAKKRGRPRTKTPEERREAARARMRKKRAK